MIGAANVLQVGRYSAKCGYLSTVKLVRRLTEYSSSTSSIDGSKTPSMRKPHPRSSRGVNTAPKHQKTEVDKSNSSPPLSLSSKIPTELLQRLLNVFNSALYCHTEHDLSTLIQQVKQCLFKRDFANAFGRVEFLEAYAVRWSPSRALAYTHILCGIPILATCLLSKRLDSLDDTEQQFSTESSDLFRVAKEHKADVSRVVCIGAGGGAEIVALGGFLEHLQEDLSIQQRVSGICQSLHQKLPRVHLDITAIDIAEWDSVIERLHYGITKAPTPSQYASAETKAASCPLVDPSAYAVRFVQQDVLNMDVTDLTATFAEVPLVTLMFTLNELYSTSMTATTKFLLSLTMLLKPGALLLVVDSPGSYSTVKLGSSSESHDECDLKKYPMQWLLDHTLLESATIGSSKNASAGNDQWEKLVSRESEWFRLPKELVYPIDLEDIRYQVHLYRRL